ncbi:MAG: FHA domain-containing protein [Thiohalomonadaceae bacterium]
MSTLTLSFKGMELKVITLAPGEMIIGSDPTCAIHIDSLAVQPRHASVITRGNETVLRDLGSPDGTFVNNERVTERVLKDRDNVRVGKHNLVFSFSPITEPATRQAATAPAASPSVPAFAGAEPEPEPEVNLEEIAAATKVKNAWLQIMSGHNVGKNISLNRKLTNLGTPGIQTAVIAKRNDGYFLSHLEGDQTPKVGNVPIGDKSWPLNDGDIIQIGNVKMQFYFE